MKGKRYLLIGVVLGTFAGWLIAFFYLSDNINFFSFLLSLLTCLIIISSGMMLIFAWRKRASIVEALKRGNSKNDSNFSYSLIWLLPYFFIAFGGLIISFLHFKHQQLSLSLVQHQHQNIKQQSALLESVNNSSYVLLTGNIFNKIDDELKENPSKALSDETISRIVVLSNALKPYPSLEGDTLSANKLSPGRGLLLSTLAKMKLDSGSFAKIKMLATFAGADLSGVDLRGANLRKADLRGANFKEADLRSVDLRGAAMNEANLWAANLRKANLIGVKLKRANLSWADLEESQMMGADLSGANLDNVRIREVNLNDVDLKWATMKGALMNKVDLTNVELSGTDLEKANLQNANLSGTDLRWTNFSEANLRMSNLSNSKLRRSNLSKADLSGANLSGADFSVVNFEMVELNNAIVKEENWLEKLNEWQVQGAKRINKKYKILKGPASGSTYRLEKITDE